MSTSAATSGLEGRDPAEIVGRLWDQHSDALLRYCRSQLRSGQEAEDALQTTFLNAVQALQRGAAPVSDAAWLFTIARNVCISQARAAGRRARHTSDVALELISAPERRRDDMSDALSEALATLPERQRRAYILREWLGFPSREVASRLGMADSETYALLTRARRTMATALTPTMGRTATALNFGGLALKLRALFSGGAGGSKAATAVVAVAIAGGSAVVVERSIAHDPAPSRDAGAVQASAGAATTAHTPVTPVGGLLLSPVVTTKKAAATAAGGVKTPVRRPSERPVTPTQTTPAPASVPPEADPAQAPAPGGTGTASAHSHAAPVTSPTRATPVKTVARLRPVRKVVETVKQTVGATKVELPTVTVPDVTPVVSDLVEPIAPIVPPPVTEVIETVGETIQALPPLLPPALPPAPPLLP